MRSSWLTSRASRASRASVRLGGRSRVRVARGGREGRARRQLVRAAGRETRDGQQQSHSRPRSHTRASEFGARGAPKRAQPRKTRSPATLTTRPRSRRRHFMSGATRAVEARDRRPREQSAVLCARRLASARNKSRSPIKRRARAIGGPRASRALRATREALEAPSARLARGAPTKLARGRASHGRHKCQLERGPR